jgi:riboflavin kinase / FMN adenylyltransferase
MKKYTNSSEICISKGTIVTIGTFDGIHVGHKTLLSRLIEDGNRLGLENLVFTFHPHPRLVLFPNQHDLRLLNTPEERVEILKSIGIAHLLEFPFTKEFSEMDPTLFVTEILLGQLNMKKIVLGYDHRFGRNREGSLELMKQLSLLYDFEVEEIPAKEINSMNVSSTRIRKALHEGDMQLAAALLGYDYFFTGTIVEGKKLGRTIGYPTANLSNINPHKLIPASGVYAVEVKVNGLLRKGMMNIGTNPTTDTDHQLKLEVNIFDFEEDVYNKDITVIFKSYIRKEEKFNGLEELKLALELDKRKTLEIFGNA